MKSRTKYIGLVILIILALSMTACLERSASQGLDTVPNMLPTPEAEGMDLVEQLLGTPGAEEDPFGTLPPIEVQEPTAEPAQEEPTAEPVQEEPTVVTTQPLVETVRPQSYTLQRGEFPYCIARRYNVSPQELMTLNGLTAAQSRALQPGLVLQVPQTSTPFPGSRALLAHPTDYVVQSNDTVYSIACKFGDVDPVNIAANNGLVAPYTLTVGSVLRIP